MIYYHADDYGISLNESKIILQCCKEGVLNSISVIPNGENLEECMQLLKSQPTIKRVNIHINLVEGKCCADKKVVNRLIDEQGKFCLSFTQLLWLSFFNNDLREQIKLEIRAQLKKVYPLLPSGIEIGIDSHQHTHMIFAIWDNIFEEVENGQYKIDFVRVPAEPIIPFLKWKVIKHIKLINLVKNLILNILWKFNKHKNYVIKTNIFFGIMFSGNMDYQIVNCVLPSFKKISVKKKSSLEILFHPGTMDKKELLDERKLGFAKFYFSIGRINEQYCIKKLRKEKHEAD